MSLAVQMDCGEKESTIFSCHQQLHSWNQHYTEKIKMCFPTLRDPFSNHHAATTNFFLPFLFVLLVCPRIPQLSLKKAEARISMENWNVNCGICSIQTAEVRKERRLLRWVGTSCHIAPTQISWLLFWPLNYAKCKLTLITATFHDLPSAPH